MSHVFIFQDISNPDKVKFLDEVESIRKEAEKLKGSKNEKYSYRPMPNAVNS